MHSRTRFARSRSSAAVALVALALALCAPVKSAAQPDPQSDPERQRAMRLYDENNYVEAAPLLEKVAKKYPEDVPVLAALGFSLYASTASIKDPAARRAARDRAREVLERSRALGDDSNLTTITLDALASGDTTDIPFTAIKEAETAIRAGEEAFVRGDLQKALGHYERAFQLDPRLYSAALFAGDMYFKMGVDEGDTAKRGQLMDKAGEWFAKAVRINQDMETAHRYWGDALMMGQNKRNESLAKFVEAVIAEPYNRRSWVGLVQWANRYGVRLAHPKIEPPVKVSDLKDNKMDVTVAEGAREDDGSAAWTMYALARAAWRTGEFAKRHPAEKAYRHSLAEEAAALGAVVEGVKNQQKEGRVKTLDPQLAALVELHDKGLVEAYVLLARPDEGVALDYAAYRKANRDKLRRYMTEYVAAGKNWPRG